MNELNLSEMALDSQNKMIDLTEYELDETALESVSGGGFWEDFGRGVGEILEIPREIITDVSRGFQEGFAPD